MKNWTRREFLQATLITAGTLATSNLLAFDVLLPVADPIGLYPYTGWETFYRDQWSYDSFGRSTHSMNCTGSCTWKAYVKNGVLFKEEQYADYPPFSATIPSYNPRGCQKGANHKEYIYGPQRVKTPLRRVGARGEGKWQAISWDVALTEIAQKMVGHMQLHGPDSVNFYAAIPAKHQITVAGGFRLSNLIGAVNMSFYDWYCDLPPGEPQTWGVQTDSCEAADWYNSKYLILWGANLVETRIPDAHFFTEARANGTKIVAIFPDYNGTCTHSDIHVPVKAGYDNYLALGMARLILENGLHDIPYIKQYTDMPFLVNTATKKFLRESDMVAGGSDAKFYLWDTVTNKAVLAPGTNGTDPLNPPVAGGLNLGAINPALEGNFTVKDLNGFNVAVTTVFARLKQKLFLPEYALSNVATLTGLDANLIRQIALEFANTKPARIIEGAGTNHYFHNDLINRAQILLVALTGNVGKPGGGFDHYVGQEKIWPEEAWFQLANPLGRPQQRFQNTTLWTYIHANVASDVDPLYPRPISSYIAESVAKGWMPLWPKDTLTNNKQPKSLIIWGGNYINQAKGHTDLMATLLPKLDLIVDINFRMDTSAYFADYVLPAACHFEKWDLNSTDLHTYMHPFTPVIPPQYNSRTDWQIWRGLALALQNTGYSYADTTPSGVVINRNFATLLNDFDTTNVGVNGNVANDKDAAQFILSHSVEGQGMTMDSIAAQPARFPATSEEWTSDLIPGEAYYGFQRMTAHKRPLATLTGRQQFYIDHDWYINEFKEELPVAKPPVNSDNYPLRWVTPHGRWSIHSTWRDAKYQLRLQRGRTVAYISPTEATKRGLKDNDTVIIYNGHGSMEAQIDISARMPDGVAQMYHGWERYMNTTGWQAVTGIRINPTQLAGGYGQLKFRLNYWGPTGSQKDTRVEIMKKV